MSTLLDRLSDGQAGEMEREDGALAALLEAEAESDLPASAEVAARLPEKGVSVGLTRYHARCLDAEGREAEATQTLFALAERLNQAGYYRALGHLLVSLLPREPLHAAPLVARAREHGGDSAVPDELLFEAQRRHPGHGLLSWLAAQSRFSRGEVAQARRLAGLALPELAAEKNYETAESALLLLAEDPAPDLLPVVARTLEILARQGAWEAFETAFGLLQAQITAPPGPAVLWPVLREIWRRHPEREGLRGLLTDVLRGYLTSRYPDPEALLRLCEIDRPSQPAALVLERLDRGERFPPGYYVRHSGWGLGRIRENDTQAVVIDFPLKPLHRMSMATAEQALLALSPDDLRVLLAVDPEGLRGLAGRDPASIVVKALQTRKEPRASTEELRRQLVPEVISASAWPGWWKGAQVALAADPRIDHRRAYANTWSLAEATGADETPVPSWDPNASAIKNLALLATFLDQHPGETEALLSAHRGRVERLADGTGASPEEAAAAGLWLLRVDPTARAAPEVHVGSGFDMNALSRQDQESLLPRLGTLDAFAAALDSRLAGLRRAAREALEARDGDGRIRRALLTDAGVHPEAVLELVEQLTPEGTLPGDGAGWSRLLLLAALELLEHPPREAHRKRALALVAVGSPLDAFLRVHPIPEEERPSVASRLAKWQASDRYRFPVLDVLKANGHEDISLQVEAARARAAARVSGRVGGESEDPYDGATLLTRATFQRLEGERQRVGIELKTTIPRAIQKARELGDLRENAEYEAAKAKQAVYAKRFSELEGLLSRVRLIDDLKRDPGVASPGTEIRLREAEGDRTWRYWILGEGDQGLSPEVVSYRAPLGKALLGRQVGEVLELPVEGGAVRCRVDSIEERVPSVGE